jgi:hypothetical protein
MSLKEFFFGFSDETRAAFPNLFINHNIDRHQCRRVVPMEVLSLGMGRTGTTSMAAAFALLGFPTSHGGADMHSNPLDGRFKTASSSNKGELRLMLWFNRRHMA